MSEKLKQVKVNFYPEQHKLLKEKAAAENVTIAQYIRSQLDLNLDEKDTRKIYAETQKKVYKETDPKLLYEISKIGNNLNQIARQINRKKDDVNTFEILQSLVEIENNLKSLF